MYTTNVHNIKILGAGISGLTAAINLALRGFHVEIYERRGNVGSQSKGFFQGLENWTSPKDTLSFLSEINIKPDFEYEPFRECYHYDSNLKKYTMKSLNVGFYLIRRGLMEGALDNYLENLAKHVGVTIHYNSMEEMSNVDIIATGYKKPFLIADGVNFDTDIDKLALMILDDQIAPYGYTYLIGLKGYGTIAVVSKADTKELSKYLERAIDRFQKILKFQIDNPVNFGGCGTRFSKLGSGTPRVGEAGGFQDAMWGFGLRLAFHTGYLAAKAISEKLNYWALVRKEVVPLCKSSTVNRLLYDLFKTKRYNSILSSLANAPDPIVRANRLYAPIRIKTCLFPIANIFLRQ
jgi:flavin-dependent dehydrogenase